MDQHLDDPALDLLRHVFSPHLWINFAITAIIDVFAGFQTADRCVLPRDPVPVEMSAETVQPTVKNGGRGHAAAWLDRQYVRLGSLAEASGHPEFRPLCGVKRTLALEMSAYRPKAAALEGCAELPLIAMTGHTWRLRGTLAVDEDRRIGDARPFANYPQK